MNREFLQLAQSFDRDKHYINGWFASEKLDGMRAFWDGGISQGIKCSEIPFANTEKDFRFIKEPVATGLWSRYGKPIYAPDWWLEHLPRRIPLDGELYMGRGMFQQVMSTCKDRTPGAMWGEVKFMVFGAPEYSEVFCNGKINNPNFRKNFTDCLTWACKHGAQAKASRRFNETVPYMRAFESSVVTPHLQVQLEFGEDRARATLDSMLQEIIKAGGEGLMLQHPTAYWIPKRSPMLLKVKALNDAEAVVVGYTWGRETDKGSKLLGKMGAAIVEWNGKKFELSGFTDAEREMSAIDYKHPGEVVVPEIHNPKFPRGTKITFKYRELTDDGIPKEARYWRSCGD